MKLIPTQEQQTIIDTAKTGVNLAVHAGAGTSKTTSCILIAEKVKKQTLYLAFTVANKKEAQESFSHLPHVEVNNWHSLAYHSVVKGTEWAKGGRGKDSKCVGYWDVRGDISKIIGDEEIDANEITRILQEFCKSSSLSLYTFIRETVEDDKSIPLFEFSSKCDDVWVALTNPKNGFKINHDIYLKMYQLSKPNLSGRYEVLILDEGQDTSPVCMDIFLRQEKFGIQLIIVGDEAQCLIEGTTVSEKDLGTLPIESVSEGMLLETAIAGKTFYRKVEKTYRKYVEEDLVKITTTSGKEIFSTKNHTHFAQLPKKKHGYIVYLMYKDNFGFRIGCTQDFRQRCSQEGADKCWILKTFGDNQLEARIYEHIQSLKYALPRIVYAPRVPEKEFPQEYFNRIFHEIDSETGAKELLLKENVNFLHPHYTPKSVSEGEFTFTITLLSDIRNLGTRKAYHRYSIIFSEEEGRLFQQKYPEFNIRDTGKQNKTVRLEGCSWDLSAIYAIWDKVKDTFPKTNLKELANIAKDNSFYFCRAENVFPEMEILVKTKDTLETDTVAKVEYIPYRGYVYDLDIQETHNFIANGVVTHNSIYGWRGAVNAFDYIPKGTLYGGYDELTPVSVWKHLTLSESFRFGQKIADKANIVLSAMNSEMRLIGRGTKVKIETRATLVRNNSTLFNILLAAADAKQKVEVVADLKDLYGKLWTASFIRSSSKKEKTEYGFYPDAYMKGFKNWKEFTESSDPEARKIVNILSMTDKVRWEEEGKELTGLKAAIAKANSAVWDKGDRGKADFVLVTAFKAKGLEYDEVTLTNDLLPMFGDEDKKQEVFEKFKKEQGLELFYVAITRAKVKINLTWEIEEFLDLLFSGELV